MNRLKVSTVRLFDGVIPPKNASGNIICICGFFCPKSKLRWLNHLDTDHKYLFNQMLNIQRRRNSDQNAAATTMTFDRNIMPNETLIVEPNRPEEEEEKEEEDILDTQIRKLSGDEEIQDVVVQERNEPTPEQTRAQQYADLFDGFRAGYLTLQQYEAALYELLGEQLQQQQHL